MLPTERLQRTQGVHAILNAQTERQKPIAAFSQVPRRQGRDVRETCQVLQE